MDNYKFRTYPNEESCEEACMNSSVRRYPVALKNGKWAAMTSQEQYLYEKNNLKKLPTISKEKLI